MDKEDIIKLARLAGCHDNGEEFRFVEFRYLERFADLVTAAEREACAKVCEELVAHIDKDKERDGYFAAVACTLAIRARGNT